MRDRIGTLRRVAADPILRRVEVAYAAFSLAETASWLALLVYAFERGGTREAGVVSVLALGSAVVAAPFASYAGDRYPPNRAFAVGFVVQSVTMAVAAVGIWGDLPGVAYAAGVAVTCGMTFTRPVVASLLPAITKRPADLVAANVVMSSISDVGLFLGPLLTALLLAVWSPAAVFAVFALLVAAAAVLALGLRVEDAPAAVWADATVGTLWSQLGAGLVTLRRQPVLRLLVVVMSVTGLSVGAMDVLVVTVAEERLAGRLNVGVLAAGVGLGAIAGSLVSTVLIRRVRLANFFLLAGLAMSVPMLVVVAAPDAGLVLAAAAVVGAGQSVLWVVGNVALQRWAPDDVVARIFGINESMQMLAMACGAAMFAVLAEATSLRWSAAIIGVVLIGIAAVTTWRFVASGADVPPPPAELVDRLRLDPIFAPLDVRAIEVLAFGAVPISRPSGSIVIAEGEPGDRYYLVLDGLLRVIRGGAEVRRLGPGHSFGEIALIRDIPRSATVVSIENTRLLAIDREHFLRAVTGHPSSLTIAAAVADRHRASDD